MSITKEKLIGFISSIGTCLIILFVLSLFFLKTKKIRQEGGILIDTSTESWVKKLVAPELSKLDEKSNLNQRKIQKNKILSPFEETSVVTQKDEQTIVLKSSQNKRIAKKRIKLIERQISDAFGEKGISCDNNEKNMNFYDVSEIASGSCSTLRGYGSANLQGRSLKNSLQKPSYDSQEEGSIVVEITVNQQGNVVRAGVRLKGTNIENLDMRYSAVEAAKKAKFNAIEEEGQNQVGTITYKYVLK